MFRRKVHRYKGFGHLSPAGAAGADGVAGIAVKRDRVLCMAKADAYGAGSFGRANKPAGLMANITGSH